MFKVYNSSAREWQLQNESGEVIANFPRGPAGEELARLKLLEIQAPNVYEMVVRAQPEYKNSAIKAGELVASGKVRDATHSWVVLSQSRKGKVHRVYTTKGRLFCNCEAAIFSKQTKLCKHSLAVILHEKVKKHEQSKKQPKQSDHDVVECDSDGVAENRQLSGTIKPELQVQS